MMMNSQRWVPPQVASLPPPVLHTLVWAGPTVAWISPSYPIIVNLIINSNVLNPGIGFLWSHVFWRPLFHLLASGVSCSDAHQSQEGSTHRRTHTPVIRLPPQHPANPPLPPFTPPPLPLQCFILFFISFSVVLLWCVAKKMKLIPSCRHLFLQTVNWAIYGGVDLWNFFLQTLMLRYATPRFIFFLSPF